MTRLLDVLEETHKRLPMAFPVQPRILPLLETRLIDSAPANGGAGAHKTLPGEERAARIPEECCGQAEERIVEILRRNLAG